jgi:alkylation response protein AidB-like acyl-CoA dehydrogenase
MGVEWAHVATWSHMAFQAFAVPKELGNITIGKAEDKLGIRASSTCPVSFDAVKVPAKYVRVTRHASASRVTHHSLPLFT